MASRAAIAGSFEARLARFEKAVAELRNRIAAIEARLDASLSPTSTPAVSGPTPSGRRARPTKTPAVPPELDPSRLAEEDPSSR
jgi:hypothetical protein